jgi:NitT/TauT family transport system ATP-binding protein
MNPIGNISGSAGTTQAAASSKWKRPHLASPSAGYITITDASLSYRGEQGVVHALDKVNLTIEEGSFVSVVGPSGCGKSTMLNVIADLLTPTTGTVTVGGARVDTLSANGRIGIVFQQANLMPWLTIRQNIALLRELVQSKNSGRDFSNAPEIDELIETVGLGGFAAAYPHQLSGGMQQRAALARALALDPDILLMDEPFAALDEITRDRMGHELTRVWSRYRKTVLFVTHNLAEAVFLSDRIILMTPRPGRIVTITDVDLPRPRENEIRFDDAFTNCVTELNRELHRISYDEGPK